MKLIGFRCVNFVGKDGRPVCGVSMFVTRPITADGIGETALKVFVSQRVLDAADYEPCLGDDVDFLYNRFGKVTELRLVRLD